MANEIGNIGSGVATGAGIGSLVPGVGTAIGAGAGGLLGIIKSLLDSDNERKDRITQSITDRYSPWTGMRGKMVEHTNPLGEVAALGAQGAALGTSASSAKSQDALNQALADRLGAKGGADAMTTSAVKTAQSGPGSDGARLSAPIDGVSSSLGADIDPVTSDDAVTLALLTKALKNRQTSGLT